MDEFVLEDGLPFDRGVHGSDTHFCDRTEAVERAKEAGGERMHTNVDHHDAELLLRLYDLRREEKLRRAREWFGRSFRAQNAEEFEKACPPGSEENAYFRMVISYWEMAASIVNHGLIQEQFFFENSPELWFTFERSKAAVGAMRERQKNPHIFENLEKLAARFEKWADERAPGSIEARRKMMSAMGRAEPAK